MLAANSILLYSGENRHVDMQWARQWFHRNKKWYKTLRVKALAQEREI